MKLIIGVVLMVAAGILLLVLCVLAGVAAAQWIGAQ